MIIYADTETHLITDADPVPRLVVSAYHTDHGSALVLRDDPSARDALAQALSPGHRLVMHNAPFDLLVWSLAYPELEHAILVALHEGRIHDTMIRAKLIDHAYGRRTRASSYTLAAVAEQYGAGSKDAEDPYRTLYAGLDGTPLEFWPEGARKYALHDAEILRPIFAAQDDHAECLKDEAREVRAAVALEAQTAHGTLVDQDRARTLRDLFADQRVDYERALVRSGLARPKHKIKRPSPLVKNQKAARAMIVDLARANGQEYVRTDKRAPALSAEALEHLHVPEDHPLYAYRALGSLVSKGSTYLDPLLAADPLIRGSYDTCVETGRTSMYGPNRQNTPRDVLAWIPRERLPEVSPGYMYPSGEPLPSRPLGFRECQIPRPGHCFVISDWSMMELVCLAQTCLEWFGWSRLADALNDGRDPHEELGGTIAGHSLGGHPKRKLYRTLAKAPNFGFPGGLGAANFAATVLQVQYGPALRAAGYDGPLDEAFAQQLKQHWRAQWPEMVHYARRIGALASCGSATIELARSGYVRGGMGYTEASNFPFQGRASRAAKDALWRCYVAHRAGALGAPVLFVHDEIVTECPISEALEHAALQERIMVDALRGVCPDVRGGVETMITTCYTK